MVPLVSDEKKEEEEEIKEGESSANGSENPYSQNSSSMFSQGEEDGKNDMEFNVTITNCVIEDKGMLLLKSTSTKEYSSVMLSHAHMLV